MFTVTRFCVQPYALRAGSLVPQEARQYRWEDDAVGAGRLMRRRVAGVAVYKVTGEPVSDLWREPVLIEEHGSVPVEALPG